MEYIWHYKTTIGEITLAANTLAITGLWFDGQKYYADTLEAEHEEKLIPVIGETGRLPDMPEESTGKRSFLRWRARIWTGCIQVQHIDDLRKDIIQHIKAIRDRYTVW